MSPGRARFPRVLTRSKARPSRERRHAKQGGEVRLKMGPYHDWIGSEIGSRQGKSILLLGNPIENKNGLESLLGKENLSSGWSVRSSYVDFCYVAAHSPSLVTTHSPVLLGEGKTNKYGDTLVHPSFLSWFCGKLQVQAILQVKISADCPDNQTRGRGGTIGP